GRWPFLRCFPPPGPPRGPRPPRPPLRRRSPRSARLKRRKRSNQSRFARTVVGLSPTTGNRTPLVAIPARAIALHRRHSIRLRRLILAWSPTPRPNSSPSYPLHRPAGGSRMQLEDVQVHYPDARQETDGSITFECPICRADGRPGKKATLYKSVFVSCVCFAAAGMKIENRDHCEPMAAELGLRQAAAAFIVSTLFKDDRKIDLDLERVNKSVQFLTA